MRVAICFSGLARTYTKTHSNFVERVLAPNQHHSFDIFISTWNVGDSNTSTYGDTLRSQHGRQMVKEEPLNLRDIYLRYHPTACLVEQPKIFDAPWSHQNYGFNSQSVLSMTYKIQSADNLRRTHELVTGKPYDLVARLRFDTLFPHSIILDDLDTSVIHVPSMLQRRMFPERNWTNDKFAIGKPDAMAAYCKWFSALPTLVARGIPFQPETSLCAHLAERDVKWKDWGCEMEIVRP